jgi:hypothetical protein
MIVLKDAKKRYSMKAKLFFAFSILCMLSKAQDKKDKTINVKTPEVTNPAIKAPSIYKNAHILVEAGIAVKNNYAIGDLDTWLMELNQTPDAGVHDGTESFYYASLSAVFPLNKKKDRPVCLGPAIFIDIPHSNSGTWPIQTRMETFASTSSVSYIRLKPLMMGLSIPLKFPISEAAAFNIIPSALYGTLTGNSYGAQDKDTRNYTGEGLGYSIALGCEVFFGKKKMIGFNVTTGYRFLKTNLKYTDANAFSGTTLLQNGSAVTVNLSGVNILGGLIIRFKKQAQKNYIEPNY